MAISTASGPWRSLTGFITPITYIFATDIVGGEYQILDAGAEILVLSPADGGPASAVDFILPNVETNDGNTWLGPQSAKAELNGIKGSITNYGAVAHVLKGTGTQPVSGNPAGVTVAAASIVQWGGNGNPNAPWIAINNAILAS